MDKPDPRLIAGEEIVFRTRKHWAAMVADSGAAVLMIIGALVVAWLQTPETGGLIGFINRVLGLIELALFLGGLGWIVYNLVAWRSSDYVVTNHRLLGQEGLLRKKETDSLLASITDVRSRTSLFGRTLGFGSVSILSASGEAGADTFTAVRKSEELKKHILEQKVKTAAIEVPAIAGAPVGDSGAAATGAASPSQVLTTLAVLASLRDAGTITPDEYESKKTDLLARNLAALWADDLGHG